MKSKYFFFFILFHFLIINCYPVLGWGNKAHKLINEKAIEMLPDEMNQMKLWKDYIGEHASDADIRRDTRIDTTEWPRHYIDIDFYPEFLNGNMITDKNELVSLYGEEKVTKMGLLPWATFTTYENLKKAFSELNRDKVLIYAADLGHYIGDGHQPFHTMLNYDGQLTDQKGIHGRYESEMVNEYFDQIEDTIKLHQIEYVTDPLNYIFDFLTRTNSFAEVIFIADKIAYDQTGKHGGNEYYRLLWFRTKYLTIDQISHAAESLASLIYTAWIDAGKPNLSELN